MGSEEDSEPHQVSDVALMNLCRSKGSLGSMRGIAGLLRRRSTEALRRRIAVGIGGGGGQEGSEAAKRSISRGSARARFPPAESPAKIAVSFAVAEAFKRVGRRFKRIGRESAAGDFGANGYEINETVELGIEAASLDVNAQ